MFSVSSPLLYSISTVRTRVQRKFGFVSYVMCLYFYFSFVLYSLLINL